MDNEKIGAAVIGAGGRSRAVTKNLLEDSNNNVKIISVFDPDKEVAKETVEHWKSPETKICESFQEAIDIPDVKWVLIFSPNAYHKEHILYAFSKGKHVFAEKPLATTIEDCQEIYEAHKKTDLLFATGFVLRYAPIYRKAKEILASGKLGKILSLEANENITPGHGGYIMRNWRRLTKYAGPHILEKCCHDLDLMNWLCESIPSKVASFGSNDFFIPENEHLFEKYGEKLFAAWPDPHAEKSPFTSEKDLLDNQVCILCYRNGIKATFRATMSNTIPERRMYFTCTEGNLILELYSRMLKYRILGDEGTVVIDITGDGHGGGDSFIMKELYETMSKGTAPKCSGEEGLKSAVTALALDKAAHTGMVIDMEPIWANLNC